MNRVLAAARLQVVHPLVIFGVPWMVVGISFALNVAIWGLADVAQHDPNNFTGGVTALYITVCVVFVQALTQLLPFAMGVSLSRRTYWLGTALVGVLSALGYGIALAVLNEIGQATGGWGVDLNFWVPTPMLVDNFFLQVLVSGAPMLALIFTGIGIGVVFKRWGSNGLWTLVILSVLFSGGLAVLATGLNAWGDVWRWLTDQSTGTLAIGIPVAIAAVVAALSYGGIRRVVP
ncbi:MULTISPECIES: hypothetical protein [unclassified Geodermatophilus]|uniref:hypothetical protein n=1 Tax=unclassified Geodermatophilus TaxID=2637632 RepID=UPI003EEBD851